MKKFVALICALTLVLSVSACSKSGTETTQASEAATETTAAPVETLPTPSEEIPVVTAKPLYGDLLDNYFDALLQGLEPMDYENRGLNYLPGIVKDINEVGYCLQDMDGDGSTELLIGSVSDNLIYAMYTMKDDEEVQLIDAGERNTYQLTSDGVFLNRGSNGAASYGTALEGSNTPLFRFGTREEVAPENRSGMSLTVTFSKSDSEQLNYNTGTGLYEKLNADGSPMTDADNGQQAAFTNVFVLYASSGVKDDGVTRQYDLTGGTGIYLTKGGWETIQWTKGDATAPLQLTDASGKTLDVNPGKSFLAIWGGYYGQALRLLDGDGNEQALPEKPALLNSAVPDEAAEAAEQAQQHAQALADAQDKLNQAQTALNEALQAQQDAAGTADSSDDDAASQRVAEAQAAYDAAAAELAALQPAEETDGNTEPAADSAEEPQSEPDSANGENAG